MTSERVRDHYAAIGYVASAWGAFEQVCQREVWELAGLDGLVGACLTANIGINARVLDALAALCRYRGADDETIKPLSRLIEESGNLGRKRNRAVHDAWGFHEESGLPYRLEVSAAKELVVEAVGVKTKELIEVAQRILDHTAKFEKTMRGIKRKLSALPSPETSQ